MNKFAVGFFLAIAFIIGGINSLSAQNQTDTFKLSMDHYNQIIRFQSYELVIRGTDTTIQIDDTTYGVNQVERWLVSYLFRTDTALIVVYYNSGQVFKKYYDYGEGYYGSYTEYYPNGNLKTLGQFDESAPGKKTGFWTEYYENGQTESKGAYADTEIDRKTGPWEYYYETGQLKAAGSYSQKKNGRKVGKWMYFDDEGIKTSRRRCLYHG